MNEIPRPKNIRVFSDFESTITSLDVCNEIFNKFANSFPYFSLQIDSKISLRHHWQELFKSLPQNFSFEEFNDWALKNIEIDLSFKPFVNFCIEKQIPFVIISDGFEFYIEAFLQQLDLYGQVEFFANKVLQKGNLFEPIFPFASESCECNVGSCKRNIALNKLREDEILVYIGGGFSDFCMVHYSDIIFAKKVLARYCNTHKIPHFTFRSFYDIMLTLQKIITDGILKFRRQAYLARLKAFENE